MPMPLSPRDFAHTLVNLRFAERIACVRCGQEFDQHARVTDCPNATDGGHALVPAPLQRTKGPHDYVHGRSRSETD